MRYPEYISDKVFNLTPLISDRKLNISSLTNNNYELNLGSKSGSISDRTRSDSSSAKNKTNTSLGSKRK